MNNFFNLDLTLLRYYCEFNGDKFTLFIDEELDAFQSDSFYTKIVTSNYNIIFKDYINDMTLKGHVDDIEEIFVDNGFADYTFTLRGTVIND